METITIPKKKFNKILEDVEMLLNDVESAMACEEKIIKRRITDIENGSITGKSEDDYYAYLKKRGIKVGRLERSVSS